MNTQIEPKPGAVYKFCGIPGKPDEQTGKPTWAHRPSLYRFIAAARYYRTGQVLYVYVGCGGDHDEGQYHLCPICDWNSQFTFFAEK